MQYYTKIAVLILVATAIIINFVYLGSLLIYPDNIVVALAGILFAFLLSIVLYMNTERSDL